MKTDEKKPAPDQPRPDEEDKTKKATVTHNLDTGEDEPLEPPPDEKSIMDFAPGSGGGSAGDGAAS